MVFKFEKVMISLQIDLQDGFKNDSVQVNVNNEEVFREEQITTDLRCLLAKQFKISVAGGVARIKVNIPMQNLVAYKSFMVDSETYLGISIEEPGTQNRKIKFRVLEEPFSYF